MNMAATHIPNPAQTAATLQAGGGDGSARAGGGDFDALLKGVGGGGMAGGEDELREAAEQLVGIAFITPMMKMMRDEPFKTEMFHGGMGEDMFAAQLDQHLAEGMTTRMRLPMVDAVYERFGGRASGGAATQGTHMGEEVDRHG